METYSHKYKQKRKGAVQFHTKLLFKKIRKEKNKVRLSRNIPPQNSTLIFREKSGDVFKKLIYTIK